MVSLIAVAFILFCLLFFVGLILLLRAAWRPRGKRITLVGFIGAISSFVAVGIFAPPPDPSVVAARTAAREARAAERAAVAEQERIEAEEAEKAEAVKIAEEQRVAAAEEAARAAEQEAADERARIKAEEADRAEAAKVAEELRVATAEADRERAAEADERRRGFHCLSPWDGSHEDFKALVSSMMRNPSSFEHIRTRINPVDANGNHTLIMDYRAENGFGGMNVGIATATVSNSTCAAIPLTVE